MPNDLKLISVPTLVSEELVPFPDFEARFKQAIIENCTAALETPGAAFRLLLTYPKLGVRTHSEILYFFRDWVMNLLMDPRAKERSLRTPVEYAAVIEIEGKQHYTFPAAMPRNSMDGFTATMILSPVPAK